MGAVLRDPDYFLTFNPDGTLGACFNRSLTLASGLWHEHSLATTAPLFCLQFGIILGLNRLFLILAEPLHLPRIALDIFVSTSNLFFSAILLCFLELIP